MRVACFVLTFVVFSSAFASRVRYSRPKRQRFQPVEVSVYYESLCPDSMSFFTDQLYPVWREMKQYMNLHLIPFGKATAAVDPEGSYTFRCQHGPMECHGNKVQACALQYVPQHLQMHFLTCLMADEYPPTAAEKCTESLSLDSSAIQMCAANEEGKELLHRYGVLTAALKPRLYFVPWVTFDGKFSSQDLSESLTNFKSVLCSKFKGRRPRKCDSSKREV